jgi:hypothetical protein
MSINWGEGQTWSIKQAFSPSKALHTCRQLYGLYFFLGGCFKLAIGLLWSDTLKGMFIERLADLPQESLGSAYLTHFAIPRAFLIAYILTLGEMLVGFLFMKNTAVIFGDVLAILKAQKFKFGGIAHAFSGGVEEAKGLIKLGFKIGVTGQITNPNAKKLHTVVQAIGAEHLVIETDCPDMTPLCCQTSTEQRTRNTPVNLPYVLQSLAENLNMPEPDLAKLLLKNSLTALKLS